MRISDWSSDVCSSDLYWLRTPAERGRIEVEDAPFTAVELSVTGEGVSQTLAFRTNLDDWVEADAAHPLRVAEDPAGGDISRSEGGRGGKKGVSTGRNRWLWVQ